MTAVTLEQALLALQRSSGVAVAFSPDRLPAVTVTCACAGSTVREALDRLLAGTGLGYVVHGPTILITPGTVDRAAAPEAILAGVVEEAGTGRPIVGVAIRLDPDSALAFTEGGGRFIFRDLHPGVHELRASALGYAPGRLSVTVRPGADTTVRVELRAAPLPVDSIVITPGSFRFLDAGPAVMASTISREQIESIPQIGDDVFRTVKRMPGVATADISTVPAVRGATGRDLLVRLDGMELIEPYHLKDLDGVFGIVDVQALGSMDLITGGFPAEYGEKWAGVFDMHTRRPPASGTRTTVGASLSSLSFISQGTFAAGRGQWLTSLRRGFLEYVLRITDVRDDITPSYWDALGRVQYTLSDRHQVSAEILHAADDVRWVDPESGLGVNASWDNSYGWLTWKAELAPWLRGRTIVSAGRIGRDRRGDGGNRDDGVFRPAWSSVRDISHFDFTGLRQDWQVDIGPDVLVKAGFDLEHTSGRYDYSGLAAWYDLDTSGGVRTLVDTTAVALAPRGDARSAYLAARVRPLASVTGEAGLRFDSQSQTGSRNLGPRLLLRWDPRPGTTVRASWGWYFEPQRIPELSAMDGESEYQRAERADQAAVGLEQSLGRGLSARAEAYLRAVDDPRPLWVNLSREIDPLLEVESDRTRLDPDRGRAAGIELLLSQNGAGPFSWSASWVLARAENRIGGAWTPVTLDQRHTVNLDVVFRPGPEWQISAAWQYHTGWPVTEQFLDVASGIAGPDGTRVTFLRRAFGPLNRNRLPPYHRLDLRLSHAFDLEKSRLETYLDIFNVYDRTNIQGYQYSLGIDSEGSTFTARSRGERLLPILPTLGFRWVF